jgi:hypothetical protein
MTGMFMGRLEIFLVITGICAGFSSIKACAVRRKEKWPQNMRERKRY